MQKGETKVLIYITHQKVLFVLYVCFVFFPENVSKETGNWVQLGDDTVLLLTSYFMCDLLFLMQLIRKHDTL